MEHTGTWYYMVGDIVMNGVRCAVITNRRTLKNGKPSKVVTLMYNDGSFRTVNVRFCSRVIGHTNKINQIRGRLAEFERWEE